MTQEIRRTVALIYRYPVSHNRYSFFSHQVASTDSGRRDDNVVELRKTKKEESLSKRRNMVTVQDDESEEESAAQSGFAENLPELIAGKCWKWQRSVDGCRTLMGFWQDDMLRQQD
jgi:Importin beta binding domain